MKSLLSLSYDRQSLNYLILNHKVLGGEDTLTWNDLSQTQFECWQRSLDMMGEGKSI